MLLLRLSNCKNCLYLPPFWQLPSLQILFYEWMTAVKRVGPEFYGTNKAFQSLKPLTFQGMLEWEEWVSSETMGEKFPCLKVFSILHCPKLRNLPQQLSTVPNINIFGSQKLMETPLYKGCLNNQDRVQFIGDDKVVSLPEPSSAATQGATKSSSAAAIYLLPKLRVSSHTRTRVFSSSQPKTHAMWVIKDPKT